MKILGLDISLRSTGFGVVERRAGRLAAVEFGLIRNAADRPHAACLGRIHAELAAVLGRVQPAAAALEGGFFFKNARTALVLGEARGAALAACAAAGVPVYEYAPRLVKQSLTGFGAATKHQVARMIMSLLGLHAPPPEDATDALAVAICHLHQQTGVAALQPHPL